MNIALIGLRGTGKTTIGKILAEKLHRPFVDSDALIVERAGKTIRDIFQQLGEPAFRDLESQVLADLAQTENQILALGGGAILRPQNVAALKPNSTFVWLQADPQTLWQRLQQDAQTPHNRPHLTAKGGGIDEIRALAEARAPAYRAASDLALDVTHLTPEQAAEALLNALKLR
jgi:shikimate kinase